MSENKTIFPTPDASVTKDDVVAALTEAESTLGAEFLQGGSVAEDTADAEQDLTEVVAAKRSDHVQQFKLDLDFDDIPDAEGMGTDNDTADTSGIAAPILDEYEKSPAKTEADNTDEEDDAPERRSVGCLPKLIFAMIILIISCFLAAVVSTFLLDATGAPRNSDESIVVIPDGANTELVATILENNGLIDNATYFRIYSRLTKADGKWQPGSFPLQADMGFPTLIEILQTAPPRETVTVMLREGLTIDEMAQLLEEKGVCTAESFLDAVQYGEYDYDFIQQIPTEEDNAEVAYRVYRLEGYLFPDTYEFYAGSDGESVVNKMLANFDSKLTDELLAQIEEQGWTLDEAITFASMVQGEGDTRENMDKVSRVLHNRLASGSGFKTLELCSTRDYANEMAENDHFTSDVLHQAYNTYKREGFPIGPIGNPGMDALLAALNPSTDKEILKCYFFATDYKTMTTYFSKTYKEHQAIIKKYGIEDLG